ncbi:MAG: hypothetical protein GX575_06005 [Candidatus Anammoximicrobium sp.]|nr:hypothetical protein [Candidatus Anammoximicrobium sp.]
MLRLVVSTVVVAMCFVLPKVGRGTEVVPTPIARDVLLNLSIDDLKTQTPVQLKRQSDGVLAQGVKKLPEALQFEVVIKGAHADIPVYFPVPRQSAVCKAYEQFIKTDPSKVLETLGGVKMPTVRVVAVRAMYVYEAYEEGELVECKPTCEWLPFYEVFLPEAACAEPVRVPVPQQDKALHAIAKRAVNKSLGPQPVVEVMQLSGDKCTLYGPACLAQGPCGQFHCGGPVEACCGPPAPTPEPQAAQ